MYFSLATAGGWVSSVLRYPLLSLLGFLLVGMAMQKAGAHAARVEVQPIPAVEVRASYDTGEPMAFAAVNVFAAENPTLPFLQGLTDDTGVFHFFPPPEASGSWTVQVRQAGHGAVAYLMFPEHSLPQTDSPSVSGNPGRLQQWIMALAVIWGFVGTALYFRRRHPPDASS